MQNPDTFGKYNLLTAQSTWTGQNLLISWPAHMGTRTLSPNCINTPAYIFPSVRGVAGLQASNSGFEGRKAYTKAGEMNEPKMLPMTTSTMAAASSPPADLVMKTLDAIVVGRQLKTTMPTKTLMWMA